jgi:RimK family alpha-L-glutamate ligase
MKNTSLMIFGCSTRRPILKRILTEAQVMNMNVSFYLYKDISFCFDDNFKILLQSKPLDFFPDAVILDWPGPFLSFRNILADYFLREKIFVLNGLSVMKWSSLNKLAQTYELQRLGIAIIPTKCSGDSNQLIQVTNSDSAVVKSIFGSDGDEVFKVTSRNMMLDILSIYNSEDLLLQPLIQNLKEFRVVVIGNHVVAAVQKEPAKGDFRGNKAKGAIFKSVTVPPIIDEVSVKCCKTFDCDFAGVDIFWDECNAPVVIEINRYLGIAGVEKAADMNISYMLLDWIEKKIGM